MIPTLPISQPAACPTVYHIQRHALVRGRLLEQHGCTVLEEQVALDGGSLQTIYTPVYSLGAVEQLSSSLLSQRAFYAVRKGECVLVYTPYRAQTRCFGVQTLLPVYGIDREAMFQFAERQSQQLTLLCWPADNGVTFKMPRVGGECSPTSSC